MFRKRILREDFFFITRALHTSGTMQITRLLFLFISTISAVTFSVIASPTPHHLPQPQSRFPSSEEIKNKTIAITPWVTTAASLGLNGVQAFYLQRNKRLLKQTEEKLKARDRARRTSFDDDNDDDAPPTSPKSYFPNIGQPRRKSSNGKAPLSPTRFETPPRRTSFSPTHPDEGGVKLPRRPSEGLFTRHSTEDVPVRRPSEGAGLFTRRSTEDVPKRRPSEGAGLFSRRSSDSLKSFVESRNQRLMPRSSENLGYQDGPQNKPWSPLAE